MIIFDLDSMADESHRQHFIVPPWDTCHTCYTTLKYEKLNTDCYVCKRNPSEWEQDWDAYHDACIDDSPIKEVIGLWDDQVSLGAMGANQIWSTRSMACREKTVRWLDDNLVCFEYPQLKMRPIDDDQPQEELFLGWLKELIKNDSNTYDIAGNHIQPPYPIDMVFSSHEKTIQMFRNKGIFVFDCNQGNSNA